MKSKGGVAQLNNEQPAEMAAIKSDRAVRARTGIIKWVILLLLVGVAYAVVVVWQRDTTHMSKAVETLEPFQKTVQAALGVSGRLPLSLGKTGPDGKALPTKRLTYLPTDDISVLRAFDGTVIVGYSSVVALGLRTDGRAVLLCHEGRCSAKWFTNAEFKEQKTKQNAWIRDRRRQLLERGPKLP